jgi:hypothetical protein
MAKTLVTEIAYFPPISIMTAANLCDTWMLETHENYQKGSFRNRCYLVGSQGPILLSVPLKKGKNRQQNIQEVEISYDEDWPTKHFRTMQTCYGSSAYFLYYEDRIRNLLESRPNNLFDLCYSSISLLLDLLNVKVELKCTKNWLSDYNNHFFDLRNRLSTKAGLSSEETELTMLISRYQQIFPAQFPISKISALDLLFNLGPEAKKYLT